MATHNDAQLILKLYELRTEATMREARRFVANYQPANFEELAALQRDATSQNNAYWRQTLSYWEMAAAFVLHEALDADLFLAANGEPFFLYAKYTPYLEEWTKTFGVPLMRQTGKMIETYPAMQERYTMMLARTEAMRRQKPAS